MEYTRDFFKGIGPGSGQSAGVIAPAVLEFTGAKSVVDVGCGTGAWLAAFKSLGVDDVLGVDGSWVLPDDSLIPASQFLRHDLTLPLQIARTFDLALCLEVAEHLASVHADRLVEDLVALAPVVLFSAAIPHQGGTAHVNEQWPTYWAERFLTRGYVPDDRLRVRFWADRRVQGFYAQNLLLFSHGERACSLPLDVVHPSVYLHSIERASPRQAGLRQLIAATPIVLKTTLANRLRRH